MEVINIIVLEGGNFQAVQSFPIESQEESDKIVDNAESLFCKLVELNNPQLTEDDVYSFLEDGYYEENNYEVILSWSSEF